MIKIENTVVQNSIVFILLKSGNITESIMVSGISNSRWGPTWYYFSKKKSVCWSKKLKAYTKGIESAITHIGAGKKWKKR